MEALNNSIANSFSPKYWDDTWHERIKDPHHVDMNSEKLIFIMKQLYGRPEYAYKEKLEIGCGTGIHAVRMRQYNPLWAEHWTGIDLSEKAVAWGKNLGLKNIIQGDIYTYTFSFSKKFNAFLFLDVLEHIEDHDSLAKRLIEIGSEHINILGNIPLYRSEHSDHYERDMDVNVLGRFLKNCGFNGFYHEIYGIRGFPYMFFEAKK